MNFPESPTPSPAPSPVPSPVPSPTPSPGRLKAENSYFQNFLHYQAFNIL